MTAGRLHCPQGCHLQDHHMAHTAAKKECPAKAGTDVPSLPETTTQFSTTANQIHHANGESECLKILNSCVSRSCATPEQFSQILCIQSLTVPSPWLLLHKFLSISPPQGPSVLSSECLSKTPDKTMTPRHNLLYSYIKNVFVFVINKQTQGFYVSWSQQSGLRKRWPVELTGAVSQVT